MKLIPRDIEDIRLLFEDALRRKQKVDRIEKIKMREMIRNELSHLKVLRNPTPAGVMGRWEDKLHHVFEAFPHWFRDDLAKMLSMKIKKRKQD